MWSSETIDIPNVHEVVTTLGVDRGRDPGVIGLARFGLLAASERMDMVLKKSSN